MIAKVRNFRSTHEDFKRDFALWVGLVGWFFVWVCLVVFMSSILYFEMMDECSGTAFPNGEIEYFRNPSELIQIGIEYFGHDFELFEVTSDNWQELYDKGVFNNEEE